MKKQTKIGLVLAAAAVISVSVASLVSARGWAQQGSEWYYVDNNGDYVTETIQSSGNAKFYLGEDGAMVRDYFLEDYDDNTYYFGSNGAMVTNTWVAIDSSIVDNTVDYIPDNYWYYFQSSGKAVKGSTTSMKKMTIDGKKYGFNEYGQMSVGWVDEAGNTIDPDEANPFADAYYYCGGDNDGVIRSGWVTYYDGYEDEDRNKGDYTNLYFYFDTNNNKKVPTPDKGAGTTKKVNGKTYAFDEYGVMLSGWDPYEEQILRNELTTKNATYFSGEDDGHQVKKGWIYEVPSEFIGDGGSLNDDDEEKYMYFDNNGWIVYDKIDKKINGKYYSFNRYGVMQDGLVIWRKSKAATNTASMSYIETVDLDTSAGDDITKHGKIIFDDGGSDYFYVNEKGVVQALDARGGRYPSDLVAGDTIALHLFGEDGARKTGLNSIEFNDDKYTFNSNNAGNKTINVDKKKYYALGLALKASSDIRYGIYVTDPPATGGPDPAFFRAQQVDWEYGDDGVLLNSDNYLVLTTSGQKQKGNNNARKDANGDYWLISKQNDGHLLGIYTENVKMGTSAAKGIKVYCGVNEPTAQTIEMQAADHGEAGIDALETAAGGRTLFREDATTGDRPLVGTMTWTKKKGSDNIWYYELTAYNGYAYQSTFDAKSNTWIPFGMIDDANKTEVEYAVTPNNDYFLNCYWED